MRKQQLEFEKVNGWGGKRRSAGRPNTSQRLGHGPRPEVTASAPMHLTWKLKSGLGNLRSPKVMELFKISAAGARAHGLRIIHFSLQSDHIHMIAEADDKNSLAKGMRSFGCRFAKGLRRIRRGQGSVFADRYHVQVLQTPTQTRNALAYVLQNFAKHSKLINHIDEFSSAAYFKDWKKLFGKENAGPILESLPKRTTKLPDYLCAARSWLAREGWMRARA